MVQWLAGEDITASKLSTTRLKAEADSTLSTTGTATDVPGATLTFTTTRDNVDVSVFGVFDVTIDGGTGTFQGRIVVDGGNAGSNFWDGGTDQRGGPSVTDKVTLGVAGSHTIKLAARQTSGSGSFTVQTAGTALTIIVEDHV